MAAPPREPRVVSAEVPQPPPSAPLASSPHVLTRQRAPARAAACTAVAPWADWALGSAPHATRSRAKGKRSLALAASWAPPPSTLRRAGSKDHKRGQGGGGGATEKSKGGSPWCGKDQRTPARFVMFMGKTPATAKEPLSACWSTVHTWARHSGFACVCVWRRRLDPRRSTEGAPKEHRRTLASKEQAQMRGVQCNDQRNSGTISEGSPRRSRPR
jgi:hypothetical protein